MSSSLRLVAQGVRMEHLVNLKQVLIPLCPSTTIDLVDELVPTPPGRSAFVVHVIPEYSNSRTTLEAGRYYIELRDHKSRSHFKERLEDRKDVAGGWSVSCVHSHTSTHSVIDCYDASNVKELASMLRVAGATHIREGSWVSLLVAAAIFVVVLSMLWYVQGKEADGLSSLHAYLHAEGVKGNKSTACTDSVTHHIWQKKNLDELRKEKFRFETKADELTILLDNEQKKSIRAIQFERDECSQQLEENQAECNRQLKGNQTECNRQLSKMTDNCTVWKAMFEQEQKKRLDCETAQTVRDTNKYTESADGERNRVCDQEKTKCEVALRKCGAELQEARESIKVLTTKTPRM